MTPLALSSCSAADPVCSAAAAHDLHLHLHSLRLWYLTQQRTARRRRHCMRWRRIERSRWTAGTRRVWKVIARSVRGRRWNSVARRVARTSCAWGILIDEDMIVQESLIRRCRDGVARYLPICLKSRRKPLNLGPARFDAFMRLALPLVAPGTG